MRGYEGMDKACRQDNRGNLLARRGQSSGAENRKVWKQKDAKNSRRVGRHEPEMPRHRTAVVLGLLLAETTPRWRPPARDHAFTTVGKQSGQSPFRHRAASCFTPTSSQRESQRGCIPR